SLHLLLSRLSAPRLCYVLFFYASGNHRDLHSFPTRRSSDLRDFVALLCLVAAIRPRYGIRSASTRTVWPDLAQSGSLLRFPIPEDRKSTRLNSSHVKISYAVFCLKKKKKSTFLITRNPVVTT